MFKVETFKTHAVPVVKKEKYEYPSDEEMEKEYWRWYFSVGSLDIK